MDIQRLPTKLESYIKARGIRAIDIARKSGYSRQHVLRVRMGRMEPTRPCMKAIIQAVRQLAHDQVPAGELFELGD